MSDDMPLFTIKAQDALAIPALEAYKSKCLEHRLIWQAAQVEKAIKEFCIWQIANIDKTKLPHRLHEPV